MFLSKCSSGPRVRLFIEEVLERGGVDSGVESSQIYKQFQIWCTEHGHTNINMGRTHLVQAVDVILVGTVLTSETRRFSRKKHGWGGWSFKDPVIRPF